MCFAIEMGGHNAESSGIHRGGAAGFVLYRGDASRRLSSGDRWEPRSCETDDVHNERVAACADAWPVWRESGRYQRASRLRGPA